MIDTDNGEFDEKICLNMLSIFFLIKWNDIDRRVEIVAESRIFDEINNVSSFSFQRRQRKGLEMKVLKKNDVSRIDE